MPHVIRNSRRWFWAVAACLTLLTLGVCHKKKPAGEVISVDQPHPPDTVPGATPLATLERTGCYGECPVYRLTVSSDGSVVYVGTRWVKVLGKQVFKLSDAQLAELLAAFERANFMQLRDYDRVENTDDDWAHVSFRRGTLVKRVRHYHGDNGAPAALAALEDDFDRITGSARFVGGSVASGTPSPTSSAGAPSGEGTPGVSGKPTKPSDNSGPPDEAVADPDNHP